MDALAVALTGGDLTSQTRDTIKARIVERKAPEQDPWANTHFDRGRSDSRQSGVPAAVAKLDLVRGCGFRGLRGLPGTADSATAQPRNREPRRGASH